MPPRLADGPETHRLAGLVIVHYLQHTNHNKKDHGQQDDDAHQQHNGRLALELGKHLEDRDLAEPGRHLA